MSNEIFRWFIIFVLFIGPALCVIGMCMIALIDNVKRKVNDNKPRSVKQWREDNLSAQHEMRKDSDWYIDKSK